MSQFFQRQESARRRMRFYRLQLWLLFVPCVASMLLATLFSVWLIVTAFLMKVLEVFDAEDLLLHPVAIVVSLFVYTALIFWWLVSKRRRQLRHSGDFLAAELKASRISRSATDLNHRRMRNITDEMALAAGIPPPALYVWPEEGIVNAITIGLTPADAAIFVTRDALATFSRDELQALAGYGVSQILNGDMALNSKLASYIYAFKFAPRVAKWWLVFPRDQWGEKFLQSLIAWLMFGVWIGIVLSIVSFPQYLAARMLQAAIGRERQKLADASALQFTRNPDAVMGALAKAMALGTSLAKSAPLLDDFAHACFAAPVARLGLSTHLPLPDRIRAIDPRFDFASVPGLREQMLGKIAQAGVAADPAERDAPQGREKLQQLLSGAVVAAGLAEGPTSTGPASADAGTPLTSSEDPRAVIIALLVDRKPETRARQFQKLRDRFDDAALAAIREAIDMAASKTPAERTRALEVALPELRPLGEREWRRLALSLPSLEFADDHIEIFEYALTREVAVYLNDLLSPRLPHGSHTLDRHLADLGLVFAVMAQTGGGRTPAAAYEAGMARLGLATRPNYQPVRGWVRPLDGALRRIEMLSPIAKEVFLEALTHTVRFDHTESEEERELLRTIGAVLHCPAPRSPQRSSQPIKINKLD